MKKLTLLITALFAITIAHAQSVALCSDYDKITGVASGIYASWDIKADGGGYIYVVYSQEKKIKDELTLKVEKKNYSGLYDTFATYSFNNDIKAGQNWAMYDMLFTEEGDYRLNVLNKSNSTLASANTAINFLPETDTYDSDTSYIDTYYYENSVVTFGESVDDGGIMNGESTVFALENGTRKITAMLDQDENLLLTTLYVTVFLGEETVSENNYNIPSKEWNYVTVPITVDKPGSYYVEFYTEDYTFINSGSFDVE